MGNALTGVTLEGVYPYYNPAHAAIVAEGNQVDLSTSAMSFDRSLHALNGSFALPPDAGLAISVVNGNVGDIDGRSPSGYPTGTLSTHEYQILSAFGLRLSSALYAGIGIKYNLADFHTGVDNSGGFGFDLGLLYLASERLTVGASVRDILSKYTWNTNPLFGDETSKSEVDRFPLQVSLGASYETTEPLLLSLEAGVLAHANGTAYQLKIGSRYRIHERVTLRGGWLVDDLENARYNNRFGAGFSLHLPFDLLAPSVDYAFLREPNNVSAMHVFGLRLNL